MTATASGPRSPTDSRLGAVVQAAPATQPVALTRRRDEGVPEQERGGGWRGGRVAVHGTRRRAAGRCRRGGQAGLPGDRRTGRGGQEPARPGAAGPGGRVRWRARLRGGHRVVAGHPPRRAGRLDRDGGRRGAGRERGAAGHPDPAGRRAGMGAGRGRRPPARRGLGHGAAAPRRRAGDLDGADPAQRAERPGRDHGAVEGRRGRAAGPAAADRAPDPRVAARRPRGSGGRGDRAPVLRGHPGQRAVAAAPGGRGAPRRAARLPGRGVALGGAGRVAAGPRRAGRRADRGPDRGTGPGPGAAVLR